MRVKSAIQTLLLQENNVSNNSFYKYVNLKVDFLTIDESESSVFATGLTEYILV